MSKRIELLKELREAGVKSATFNQWAGHEGEILSVEFFPPEPPQIKIQLPEGTQVDGPMEDALADLEAKERDLKKQREILLYGSSS